jgi:hypothetical protein
MGQYCTPCIMQGWIAWFFSKGNRDTKQKEMLHNYYHCMFGFPHFMMFIRPAADDNILISNFHPLPTESARHGIYPASTCPVCMEETRWSFPSAEVEGGPLVSCIYCYRSGPASVLQCLGPVLTLHDFITCDFHGWHPLGNTKPSALFDEMLVLLGDHLPCLLFQIAIP